MAYLNHILLSFVQSFSLDESVYACIILRLTIMFDEACNGKTHSLLPQNITDSSGMLKYFRVIHTS